MLVFARLEVDPSDSTLFIPTLPVSIKLPVDALDAITPKAHHSNVGDDHKSILRTACSSQTCSRYHRRRAAQILRVTSGYFDTFRQKHKQAGAQVVDTISAVAAAAGFPCPIIVYSMFSEQALLEAVPFDCWRRLWPCGGALVVVCEVWAPQSSTQQWVEVAVSQDGDEVWATIGTTGRPCRTLHFDLQTNVSESFDSVLCRPSVRYSPGF